MTGIYHNSATSLLKRCTDCLAFKEKHMFSNNKTKVDGLQNCCKCCVAIRGKLFRENNRQSESLRISKWAREHKDIVNTKSKNWRFNNKEKFSEISKTYRQSNPEKVAANCAAKRARKLHATPVWSDSFFMEEAYRLAKLRTNMTGFVWHVDHIVPIRSKLVCGLHAHTNIQVIPGKSNLQKSNLYWPDMPI